MREVQKRQLQFGQVPVDKVWLDPKSRDDIPAVLKGLQHLYKEKQEELFMLLEKHILPGTQRGVGRPGMEPMAHRRQVDADHHHKQQQRNPQAPETGRESGSMGRRLRVGFPFRSSRFLRQHLPPIRYLLQDDEPRVHYGTIFSS